jgi:hypothetical protein
MTDERHGVPSASGMRRTANCPPSFKLGKLFPDPRTSDSDTGDRIHKALEHDLESDDLGYLEIEEIQTYEMCADQRHQLLDEWIGEEMDYEVHKEKRLVMTPLGKVFDDSPELKVKIVFSGKADYVAVFGEGALVIDYKTLHGEHDHASINDQLRALAVLVSLRHGVSQVRVAIVQPWKGKPTVADFDKAALEAATTWLYDVLNREEVSTPDQANAGDWCKWCAARVSCVAFQDKAMRVAETAIMQLPADDETARKAMFARAAELPDGELAARYRGLKMLSWYVNAVEGNVRMRAAEGGEFAANHYRIVEGKARESIERVDVVFSNLSELGVTAQDFTATCKTTKTAVAALARKATGQKGRELDATVKRCLQGAVKLGKPPLKLVAANGTIEDEEGDDEMP